MTEISLFLDKVVTIAATSKGSSLSSLPSSSSPSSSSSPGRRHHLVLSIAAAALKRLVAYCDEVMMGDTAFRSPITPLQAMAGSLKMKLSKWIADESHRIQLARICDPRFSTRDEKKECIRNLLLGGRYSSHVDRVGPGGQHQFHHHQQNRQQNHHHHHHHHHHHYHQPNGMDELLDFGRDKEVQEEMNDEVDNFFTVTFYRDKKSDLFDWWKLNEHRFPGIARIAKDILSIPAAVQIDTLEPPSRRHQQTSATTNAGAANAEEMLDYQHQLGTEMRLVRTIDTWQEQSRVAEFNS